MSQLTTFLTALWLASATAHPGLGDLITNTATGTKKIVTTELGTAYNPLVQTIAFIGGKLCGSVKPLAGVSYNSYTEEPDMSHLSLVFINSAKTTTYNLTQAPTELPKESWFNPEREVLLFLHGFTDNPTKTEGSFQNMRLAVQENLGDVNIMALDSSSMIAFFYLRATTLVRFIGERLGSTLAALVEETGLDPKKIHLLGHSLGSHIAGFAGKTFFEKTGKKVGRITSMDPAGPCFGDLKSTLRLHKDDADFVDVIHTDAGVYGLNEQIGHVDFYPNSGSSQPGCVLQTCSHSRAWEYEAQSMVNSTAFMAVKCNNYKEFRQGLCNTSDVSAMGYSTPTTARGKYYLITYGESPYGAGELGMKYQNNGILRKLSYDFTDLFG